MAGRLGPRGEELALKALGRKGYKIIGKNIRLRSGEIDAVAKEGGEIVFVEVKTRSQDLFGSPAESVNQAKKRRLTRLAREWLQAEGLTGTAARFDVVSVKFEPAGRPRIEVIKNAFEAAE